MEPLPCPPQRKINTCGAEKADWLLIMRACNIHLTYNHLPVCFLKWERGITVGTHTALPKDLADLVPAQVITQEAPATPLKSKQQTN